jgi:hypothetical protein
MPKSDLTLSAAPDLLPEDARVAARFLRELEGIDRARRAGDHRYRRRRVDRLIREILRAVT